MSWFKKGAFMKYGFMMMMILLIALPSCCLRKERKRDLPEPMMIEEEEIMPMPYETDEIIDTNGTDMAILQDEMTPQDTQDITLTE